MGDRIAYYKHKRILDYLDGVEEESLQVTPTEFRAGTWSHYKFPLERGANSSKRYKLRAGMVKTSAETYREFQGRRLQALADLDAMAGFGPNTAFGYAGNLTIIEDDSSDVTTLASPATAGSNVTLLLDGDIGCGTGDYVLLVEGSQYEICTVNAVNPGSVRVDTLIANFGAGAVVARVLYTVPLAYLQAVTPFVAPAPGAGFSVVDGVELEFESVETPLHNL